MIRDPSDGSIKTPAPEPKLRNCATSQPIGYAALKAKHGENWGLKSLDREPRKPRPAPAADELREHYAKHNMEFKPKAEGQE